VQGILTDVAQYLKIPKTDLIERLFA